jgi:hypothetical protein
MFQSPSHPLAAAAASISFRIMLPPTMHATQEATLVRGFRAPVAILI